MQRHCKVKGTMRDFILNELRELSDLQDGHKWVRLVMLIAALCATMWLGLQETEKNKVARD